MRSKFDSVYKEYLAKPLSVLFFYLTVTDVLVVRTYKTETMLPYRVLKTQGNLLTAARVICSKLKYSDFKSNMILYGDEASPPVRFVMMTAAALEVELDFQRVDLFQGVNKSQFFKKINPLQKVPVLCAGKEVIKDSHAIAMYLCDRSDKRELLYPTDIMQKAKVNQMLFFNSSELFPIDSAILSAFFAGVWPVEKEEIDRWYFLLDYLENILSDSNWLTGKEMTLGDICCAATISSLQILVPPLDHHLKIRQWMKNLNDLPYFDINKKGLERLQGFVEKMKEFYETNKVC